MGKNGTATTVIDEASVTDSLRTFLLAKAEEFRELASERPELQNELRRMAEECEEEAARLSQERRRGGAPAI
jgi:predicted phage gp36 major capsid-like protein